MAIYMCKYSDEEGMEDSSPLPPLTTVFYPDDQIPTYHQILASTSPLSAKERFHNNGTFLPFLLENESINVDAVPTVTVNSYPSNHKRQYSEVYRNISIDATIAREDAEFPQKRISYPIVEDYDDDDDFVDASYPKTNNIQDILNQSDNGMENYDGINGAGEVGNDLILPSIPFPRMLKVKGIYRREKMKRDQLSTMETAIRTKYMHPSLPSPPGTQNKNNNVQHKFDLFLKFKPSSPSDVNLLATSDVMRPKLYTHHKPRPLITPAMTIKQYAGRDYYGSHSDPNVIYNPIVSANRFEKQMNLQNNKLFSLMLDVHPMSDDESTHHVSSTRMTPMFNHGIIGLQDLRPIYPVNSRVINQNLQFNKDLTMYNTIEYPQLQPYPYNRSPHALNPTAKEYTRNYAIPRMNTRAYGPSLSSHQTISSSDGMPSEITVHLNLYPSRKKTQNVEIINTNVEAATALDRYSTATPTTSSSMTKL